MTKEDVLKMIAEGESQCVELKSSYNVEAMETISSVSRTPITNFRQWKSPI